jgi:hypothetical protein
LANETTIALDLEGTLISNAVSQFPRPGLRGFLDFCDERFDRVCIYTAVRDEVTVPIIKTMVNEENAPNWILQSELIQWDRTVKDLTNIPNSEIMDCLIVDDNPDYIVDSQVSQWIQIEKYSSPYSKTDRELERVQSVIEHRLT